jgi:hypothetical protein
MMLVHFCDDCGKVSINRLAADDLADTLLEIFECSLQLGLHTKSGLARDGISLLERSDWSLIHTRLFGRN